MFAEEAEGRLATLSELLLELERNGEDQELLSSVFREAHTLKGAAAVVGLADVLRVAHAMEEVLEELRRGRPRDPGHGRRPARRRRRRARDGPGRPGRRRPRRPRRPPGRRPPRPPARPGAAARPGTAAQERRVRSPRRPAAAGPSRRLRRERRETVRLRVERLDELVRLVGEASAAALRVGRVVTDQLGASRPASPSCTT